MRVPSKAKAVKLDNPAQAKINHMDLLLDLLHFDGHPKKS